MSPAPQRRTVWDRLAELVLRRPGRVLALSLGGLAVPLLGLAFMATTFDTLAALPRDAESVRGLNALSEHIPAGETSPLILVFDHDESVYEPAAFRALGDLSRNLRRLPRVVSVRSAAMPTDGQRPDFDADATADAGQLSERLAEAAGAARQLADGIARVDEGLARVDTALPDPAQVPSGGAGELEEARAGLDRLLAGLEEARTGVGRMRDGVGRLRGGVGTLRAGLEEARRGATQLRTEVAEPAADSLKTAMDELGGFTVGRADPAYRDAVEAVGEAYARITGRYPAGHPRAGQRVRPDYDGLAAALDELAAGLTDAGAGTAQLDDGLVRLDGGLAELDGGLGEAVDRVRRFRGELDEAAAQADRAPQLRQGLEELSDGLSRLRRGVAERLAPGAEELAAGLTEGAAEVEQAGLEGLAADGDEAPFVLTSGLLEQAPQLREQLGFFVTDDERQTRVIVGLEAPPYSNEAIAAARQVDEVARLSVLDSPLAGADLLATGPAAFLLEVEEAHARDLPIIMIAVSLGVFGVLVALLRSLVAPVYILASVLLSYGAALGVTTIVFQGLLDRPGLQWWVPSLLFVLLMALGVDYSIFLMGRVREEARRRTTRHAVAEGVRHTGRIVTSAGVILAATFAVLLFAPLRSQAELGLAAAVGILLDTLVVRALVIPSLGVLLGRWIWWPSARAAAD